jgi:hypothetical protein
VYSPERIEKYMTMGNNPKAKWPKYEKETSHQVFTLEDLEFLRVFDFKLNEDITFKSCDIVYEGPSEDGSWNNLLAHQEKMLKSLNDCVRDPSFLFKYYTLTWAAG